MRCVCSELGLARDDVLVTQLPNIVEYPALYLAAWRLGVIVSPGAHAVPAARARADHRAHRRESRADRARNERRAVRRAIRDLADARGVQVYCLGDDAPEGTLPFAPAALSDASRAVLREHLASRRVDADDIATICWTSGTEGMPKGVPRSHNHWISISYGHLARAGIQRGDRLLNPFPLINMAAIGGCFMSWLHSAGTLVLHHPVDLGVYLQQIATERRSTRSRRPRSSTCCSRTSRLLARVDLSCLRCIGSGSAPLDPEMIARLPGSFRHRDRQRVRLERRRRRC